MKFQPLDSELCCFTSRSFLALYMMYMNRSYGHIRPSQLFFDHVFALLPSIFIINTFQAKLASWNVPGNRQSSPWVLLRPPLFTLLCHLLPEGGSYIYIAYEEFCGTPVDHSARFCSHVIFCTSTSSAALDFTCRMS